jgi:hypothetical protein
LRVGDGGRVEDSRVDAIEGDGDRVVTLLRRLWLAGGRRKPSVLCCNLAVGRRTRWDDLVGLSFSESLSLCVRLPWRDRWLIAGVFWVLFRVLEVGVSVRVVRRVYAIVRI